MSKNIHLCSLECFSVDRMWHDHWNPLFPSYLCRQQFLAFGRSPYDRHKESERVTMAESNRIWLWLERTVVVWHTLTSLWTFNSLNRENVEDKQSLNSSLRFLFLIRRALTNGWDREGSALRLRTSMRCLPVWIPIQLTWRWSAASSLESGRKEN